VCTFVVVDSTAPGTASVVVVFDFTFPSGVFAFVLMVVCFTAGAPISVVFVVEVVLLVEGIGSGVDVVVEDACSSCTVVSARAGIPTAKVAPTAAAKNF